MLDKPDPQTRYKAAEEERDRCVQRVLSSASRKKIVVAGPGTGKTHLFKKALEGKKPSLTLTFVNALVDDLSLELHGMSDVRTLHSFARGFLKEAWKKKELNIFPKLSKLIREDLENLTGEDVDFDKIFHEMDVTNPHLEFYRKRKKYYDGSYGYSDIVFAAVQYLRENRDKIPVFEQVVVDEFQDFNELEVALIDLLGERSPIILAGDDDQALYDFKSADAKHLRNRHDDLGNGYEAFNLPLCSRCTRVIVDAANDIVAAAQSNKLLNGRIPKPYDYFESKSKDAASEQFPRITHKHRFASQFAWYIESKLDEVASVIREKFSVLIIAPTKVQARSLSEALRGKGLQNVDFVERNDKDLSLLDGLKVLLENDKSNLGWRIVAAALMEAKAFTPVIKRTDGAEPPFDGLVPAEIKKRVRGMLTVLRKVRDSKPIDGDALSLLEEMGVEPYRLGLESLSDELNWIGRGGAGPGLRKLPITVSTIQGSKGLSADIVFIAYFDDAFFITRGGMIDKDVCNFLVSLTRAKKKVFLLSSQNKRPKFLEWIDNSRIDAE
jgi:superfamily I DNA/RNA helicase